MDQSEIGTDRLAAALRKMICASSAEEIVDDPPDIDEAVRADIVKTSDEIFFQCVDVVNKLVGTAQDVKETNSDEEKSGLLKGARVIAIVLYQQPAPLVIRCSAVGAIQSSLEDGRELWADSEHFDEFDQLLSRIQVFLKKYKKYVRYDYSLDNYIFRQISTRWVKAFVGQSGTSRSGESE